MAKPYDTRLIAVVAQAPFEFEFNKFCKLVPVVYVDGMFPTASDFPNDGEVWWMLTAPTAHLAEPGHLVSCFVEDSTQYDEHDQTKSRYQARRESVRDLNYAEDGLEVLELAPEAIESLQDLVSGGFRLEIPQRCTPTVMLRWQSAVCGPFTVADDSAIGSGTLHVSLSPTATDMTVCRIGEDDFQRMAEGWLLPVSTYVSRTHRRRSEPGNTLTAVNHQLLLRAGYERLMTQKLEKVGLEPIDRTLLRFAKQCLSRSKRQQLQSLLMEMEGPSLQAIDADSVRNALARTKQITDRMDVALDSVTNALLDSGLLGEDRVRKAEQAYAEKYIQERTAEFQARIQDNLKATVDELRNTEAELKNLKVQLDSEVSRRWSEFEVSQEQAREESRKDLVKQQEDLERKKAELDRQESLLRKNLEEVTRNLQERGDEVVNQFLTIAPLLGAFDFVKSLGADGEARRLPNATAPAGERPFELPHFVRKGVLATETPLLEADFFERFRRVVNSSGFTYRELDLQRFHLSVKCEDLTVLGGPSGTGKSSLPNLYARALLGEEGDRGRPGCLMVNINPSWLDIRDLVGHLNTLEGRFYPAESGLFQRLVYAQEEYNARGASTGLYLVCLDEMNLSQVEHYFSDFMMSLERDQDGRAIRCFSEEAARDHCPFRPWHRVALSPALRFVGTVNFDETTRLLSDRFLDRVNLIRLPGTTLPGVGSTDMRDMASAMGRGVTLADFVSWRVPSALPSDLGALLDKMRPVIAKLGSPVSPRVYRAICRFVSSASVIIPPASAFDIQVAQRIVPKIRGLVTRRQLDALDELVKLIEESNASSFAETLPLLEEVRQAASAQPWGWEE